MCRVDLSFVCEACNELTLCATTWSQFALIAWRIVVATPRPGTPVMSAAMPIAPKIGPKRAVMEAGRVLWVELLLRGMRLRKKITWERAVFWRVLKYGWPCAVPNEASLGMQYIPGGCSWVNHRQWKCICGARISQYEVRWTMRVMDMSMIADWVTYRLWWHGWGQWQVNAA